MEHVINTSAGPITIYDTGDGRVYIVPPKLKAELLIDTSGEIIDNGVCDGSPRLMVNAPDGGDTILYMRFKEDSVLLDIEENTETENTNGTLQINY